MTTSQDPQRFHWHYAEFDDSNFEIRGRTLFFIIVLFSIVIFVILLFLYARWVCRYRPSSTTTTSATHLAHTPPPPPQGLDPSTINSFPIILHRASSTTNANHSQVECCICLGNFQDGEKVKVLPDCHHCYHSECVDKWLKTQSSCPLCRASLGVDSAV